MITGHRVKLRAVEKEDLRKIWEWENSSEVMEFASSAPERCISLASLEHSFFSGNPNDAMKRFLVLNESDTPIGLISYWIPNPRFSGSVEIGVYLGAKDLWRQGYGTDAVMTLCWVLFMDFGVHRVGIATGSHNFRVQKGLEKYGVKVEGVIREERYMNGKYYDTVRLGVLKEEFEEAYSRWRADMEVPETLGYEIAAHSA
jgi:RimJ/RimL family protein N-acetyltransferase